MSAVPEDLRELVATVDPGPDKDGDISVHALQAGLLLALVDAVGAQTEQLKRVADNRGY